MSVIDVKMQAIYQASHVELPARASSFAGHAGDITAAVEPVVAEVALAGNHPIGADLADVAVEVFAHLRELVRTFNDCAVGLDRMADDLVAVDGEAGAWFAVHQEYVGDVPVASEPAAPEV
ncbi:MAG: hypothetical protein CMH83_04515 [Nocardioides sp.]|nr:hypothetical protein [Nocardioides sp.]